MEKETQHVGGGTFLAVWILLMILTGLLIFSSLHSFPGREIAMLVMMFAQAYLVSFYFMHLRFEKLPLVLSVVLGVFATTALLYFLIIWDGTRIFRLTTSH